MPRPPDPTSLQAHFDWLLWADPTTPPTQAEEGRALHLYLDPPLLREVPAEWGLLPDDASRTGSAAWQAAQVEDNRTDPTMEWSLIIRAWDRAAAAYDNQPALLNQLRRLQRQLLRLLQEGGGSLAAPVHPGLGVDTWVLIASNGERGARELLAPIVQISRTLFEGITALLPESVLGAFDSETIWLPKDAARLATLLPTAEPGDALAATTVRMLQAVCATAAECQWTLHAEGPEPEPEWSLGDLLGLSDAPD